MSKIKVLIELDDYVYEDVKESVYNVDSNYIEIGEAIGEGKVLPKTRKEVHKMLFGIDPPELDSPYCSCADGGDGCEFCHHKNDLNCDVNWWNEEMPILAADVADQAADILKNKPNKKFKEKIANAKPSTWLTDGLTQEEVKQAIDDAKERTKWIRAIEDIKAEIEKEKANAKNDSVAYYVYNEGLIDAHETDEQIIDKHTKELMK